MTSRISAHHRRTLAVLVLSLVGLACPTPPERRPTQPEIPQPTPGVPFPVQAEHDGGPRAAEQ